jgi:hypothetical protein
MAWEGKSLQMAHNAREIRQAIANAKHTIDPLPPITFKPARQLSHSRAQSEHGKLAERRLSNEARETHSPPLTQDRLRR